MGHILDDLEKDGSELSLRAAEELRYLVKQLRANDEAWERRLRMIHESEAQRRAYLERSLGAVTDAAINFMPDPKVRLQGTK